MQKSQEERKEAQKLVTKLEEKLGAELLSEKVSQLVFSSNILEFNETSGNKITAKVNFVVNMPRFGPGGSAIGKLGGNRT